MAGRDDFFDPGESIVPPTGAVSVDDRLEAVLSGLIPDTRPEVPRPLGRGWWFDFEKGQFIRRGIAPADARGVDQIRIWVEKTLRTVRFAHDIYDDEYGVDDPWIGIGRVFTPALAAKMQRQITDALGVHDRIDRVEDFAFDGGAEHHRLFVSFTVVLDQDDESVAFSQIPIGADRAPGRRHDFGAPEFERHGDDDFRGDDPLHD